MPGTFSPAFSYPVERTCRPGRQITKASSVVIGIVLKWLVVKERPRPLTIASDEIGQADARDEVEVVLPRVIDLAIGAVLPPEALERRHDEVEIAFDFPQALLRHLYGIGNAVEQRQRVLLRAAFGIGIALAPHGNVAHRRNDQDARLVRRFARDVVAHRRR